MLRAKRDCEQGMFWQEVFSKAAGTLRLDCQSVIVPDEVELMSTLVIL